MKKNKRELGRSTQNKKKYLFVNLDSLLSVTSIRVGVLLNDPKMTLTHHVEK